MTEHDTLGGAGTSRAHTPESAGTEQAPPPDATAASIAAAPEGESADKPPSGQHDAPEAGSELTGRLPDAAPGEVQLPATDAVTGAQSVRETAEVPATGDDRVDAALSRMSELGALDVTEHAAVFEDVHRALQDTLAEEEG